MSGAGDREARFVLGPGGRVEEANEAALELLGVSLSELQSAPPGTFSAPVDPSEAAAMRAAWVESGAVGATGESTIRRSDGTLVRVRYISSTLADGRFLIAMLPADGEPAAPATVYTTTGDVLAAWRAAERRLEALEPDDPETGAVHADIAVFRAEYRRLFQARSGPSGGS